MTTYINPYSGQTISPSQVGYESLTLSADTVLQWPVNGNTSSVVANIIEVSATAAGFKLYMPAATQVSDGQSALIRNIGAYSFTVVRSDGYVISPIASGVAEYIYVTNNNTDAGTWSAITFGTGTSAANAADLSGYGLTPIGSTLNQAYSTKTIYSDYSILSADRSSFLVWDSGVGTITLPSASSVGNNWFVMIRNGGTGILNIAPIGINTIDGNSGAQLQIDESFVVVSDGSNWNSFGYGQSTQFFFTILTKTISGGTVTLNAAEASNIIQEYTGTLTSNCTIVLPPTVQLYSLQNKTTGAFTLTFKSSTVGGITFVLPQNQTAFVVCDGTNIYNAQTSTVAGTTLSLSNGTVGSPSLSFLGDTTSGLYLPASGNLGFAIGGAQGMSLNGSGLTVPAGIKGGIF